MTIDFFYQTRSELPTIPFTDTPTPTSIPTETATATLTETSSVTPTFTESTTEPASSTTTGTATATVTPTATPTDLSFSLLLDEATATPTFTATPCLLSYAFNFRDAPLSLITIEPYRIGATDYFGTYEAGQGYKYIYPYVRYAGRWHSGIHLRIEFAQPLPLQSFRLWTEAPFSHTLTLYATDGTSITSYHADAWYRRMGWASGLTKMYTHAIYVGGIPGPAGGYVRDLDFTLRTCANPFPEQSPTPTPTSTETPTSSPTPTPTNTLTPTATDTPEICPPGTALQGIEGAEGAVTAFAPVCYINPGFYAEYYDEPDLSGYLVTRVDQHINSENFASFPPSGIDSDTFSVRWTGRIFAGITDTYTFYVNVDDGLATGHQTKVRNRDGRDGIEKS